MSAFAKETDLCCAFLDSLPPAWKKYPEQADWDILIQRGRIQVGIQAKLVADTKVLLQALPFIPGDPETGPAYRAVLIGEWTGRTAKARQRARMEFCALARHLRLLVVRPPPSAGGGWLDMGTNMTRLIDRFPWRVIDWRHYRWHPSAPLWVPPFEPDLPAGVPSPAHVTPWHLAAMLMHAECERKGWICLTDARRIVGSLEGVDFHPASILKRYWFATQEAASGRQKKWRPLKEKWRRAKTPAEKWPDIWRQVKDSGFLKNPERDHETGIHC
jgi:hypothetical protein